MKKALIILAVVVVSLSVVAQQTRHIADSVRFARRVPALVYAVVSSDKVLLKEGVGYRAFRTKDTISLNNHFHLGSATASITSYIAAQLVAKGKILWNTELLKLFPAAAEKCRPEYKTITLADLLSQRAGLITLNDYLQFTTIPVTAGSPMQQRAAFVTWVVQQKAGRDSEKRDFRFTNANTAAAVAMLEKAATKPWEDLLEEYVNKPLGIAIKTGWPIHLAANEPKGHWYEGGTTYMALDNDHWYGISAVITGAANTNITLGDYIRFIQEQLRGLRGEKAILSSRAYEIMHYSYPNYAMGWGNLEINGNHISDCDGTLGTFHCHAEIIKEKNIAIIVMCNSGDNAGKGAVLNLAKLLREMYVAL